MCVAFWQDALGGVEFFFCATHSPTFILYHFSPPMVHLLHCGVSQARGFLPPGASHTRSVGGHGLSGFQVPLGNGNGGARFLLFHVMLIAFTKR